MEIHHIVIAAQDVQHVGDFYENILGLKRTRQQSDDHGVRSIWFASGSSILMIERADAGVFKPVASFHDKPPGFHLIAFRIVESERRIWLERFSRARVPVLFNTDFTMYIMDPERNRIGLSFYSETEKPQTEGEPGT